MRSPPPAAAEFFIAATGASLYVRDLGSGVPVIVLHGGPDFNHRYLLPELDRLTEVCRLIYFDQRGRGRSAHGVTVEEVGLASEIDDIDQVRQHVGAATVALLGHSWGVLLALEYAARHPQRVSHLILLNAAPATRADLLHVRVQREAREADALAEMQAIAATAQYHAGDLQTDAQYYRAHFRSTLRKPAQLEDVVSRLRADFTPADILKARAIEQRLYAQTWLKPEYDLLSRARRCHAPTLVLHSERDFIPVRCAERIANALAAARLVVLEDCGHFSFVERCDAVAAAINEYLALG